MGGISKFCLAALLLASANSSSGAVAPAAADAAPKWEHCGWGGGGFFYATVYHPTQKGVIYLSGDVAGVYKTEDNARTWRIINNGIANYGVFSLAVDQKNPQTVYAATEGGLCKSIDAGEHWQLLPNTGKKELRITGEKGKSVRCIAVSPDDGKIIYAGSPGGKVYKSIDAGMAWKPVYEQKIQPEPPGVLYVEYGAPHGGIFFGVSPLSGVKPENVVGFGFSFKGDKSVPKDAFVTVNGAYRSKNLSEYFKNDQWQDIVLTANDFTIEGYFRSQNKEKARSMPPHPDLSKVGRVDFTCATKSSVARFSKFFCAVSRTPGAAPTLVTVKDFTADKKVGSYGSIRAGDPKSGPAYSVAVSATNPAMVVAATGGAGMVLSEDAGQTWRELDTPKRASSVALHPTDPNIMYGAFGLDGVYKSTDKGKTWTNISEGLNPELSARDVVINPARPNTVYVIGDANWKGFFYMSNDGGKSWTNSSSISVDREGDPTFAAGGLSTPTNIAVNPLNPDELFISANWRNCLSEDGGVTWTERQRGADISCITDIRFSKEKTYVTAMDEGSFVTEDDGKNWRQLWPLRYSDSFCGHNWRIAVNEVNGEDRIIATVSPWITSFPARVVVSQDSGNSFKITTTGLPNYVVTANTMWGLGYPRALSVDPKNPKIVYLGIDGDPSNGKTGGGIFKSEDGGNTWLQLPNQPASRRVFNGLMVDPTDSNRIFWAACGSNGGVHRSTDGGASWKNVFSGEQWPFNLHVTNDGTVYCPGNNLWRSTDHGTTWKKVTNFPNTRTICGLEVDPRDPKTIWISAVTWDGSSNGAVLKSTDGGNNWRDITGNLPYVKPIVLRFNPKTSELWAGGVTLHKLKQ